MSLSKLSDLSSDDVLWPMSLVMAGALALPAAVWADGHGAAPAGVTVTPLIDATRTTAGQRLEMPARPRVQAVVLELAPGATLPVHKHLYPRYGYMLAGAIRVTDTQTGQPLEFKAGDFIIEMIDRWHSGSVVGDRPARLLVIDHVPDGVPNNVVLRPPQAAARASDARE